MKSKTTTKNAPDGCKKLSISMPASLAEKALEMAKRDHRTVSGFIARILAVELSRPASAPELAKQNH